jgi:hypothetical protein
MCFELFAARFLSTSLYSSIVGILSTGTAIMGAISLFLVLISGFQYMTGSTGSSFSYTPRPEKESVLNAYWDETPAIHAYLPRATAPAVKPEPSPEERKRQVEAADQQALVDFQALLDRRYPIPLRESHESHD